MIIGSAPNWPIIVEMLGHPRGKGRPRRARLPNGVTITHSHPATAEYESNLRLAAARAMGGQAPLDGPLAVLVEAHFPIPTSWSKRRQNAALAGTIRPTVVPDAANIAAITDPCNAVLWRDDKLLVELTIVKAYSDKPRLTISVWPAGSSFPARSRRRNGRRLLLLPPKGCSLVRIDDNEFRTCSLNSPDQQRTSPP